MGSCTIICMTCRDFIDVAQTAVVLYHNGSYKNKAYGCFSIVSCIILLTDSNCYLLDIAILKPDSEKPDGR